MQTVLEVSGAVQVGQTLFEDDAILNIDAAEIAAHGWTFDESCGNDEDEGWFLCIVTTDFERVFFTGNTALEELLAYVRK